MGKERAHRAVMQDMAMLVPTMEVAATRRRRDLLPVGGGRETLQGRDGGGGRAHREMQGCSPHRRWNHKHNNRRCMGSVTAGKGERGPPWEFTRSAQSQTTNETKALVGRSGAEQQRGPPMTPENIYRKPPTAGRVEGPRDTPRFKELTGGVGRRA